MWINTRDDRFNKAYKKYLGWYISALFTEQNYPRYSPKSTHPIDIHSCSEAIYCLSTLLPSHPELIDLLDNSYNWTMKNMQYRPGEFLYAKKKLLN